MFFVIPSEVSIKICFQQEVFLRVNDDTLVLVSLEVLTYMDDVIIMDLLIIGEKYGALVHRI